jgi:hypothetical protein
MPDIILETFTEIKKKVLVFYEWDSIILQIKGIEKFSKVNRENDLFLCEKKGTPFFLGNGVLWGFSWISKLLCVSSKNHGDDAKP